jgi:mycothiol S-conjugate amidase
VPLQTSAAELVKAVREFRPHVLITYDENGGYPHPDHIRCHEVSMAAFDEAGDPDLHPDAGEPWQPLKLYYSHGFSRKRMQLFHDALIERGIDSPYGEWLEKWDSSRPDTSERVTTKIECGEYFEVRDAALLAHATQIDPNSRWFAVPLEVQRDVWPFEEYELARSLVDTTLPEDDLFSGIQEKVST